MIEILMAAYNAEKYIVVQLQSILDQTEQRFCLTIRDNCSTDHTVRLIQEFSARYPGRITLIEGTENLGAKGNFAYLAGIAKGEYIMFSDADDVWFPHKIEITLAEMKRQESIWGENMPLLVDTDKKVVDRDLNVLDTSFWRYSNLKPTGQPELNRILAQNLISGCTLMVNRALFNSACPFPSEVVMHDWWLALIATAFGRVSFILEPTMLYRQHVDNVSQPKNYKGIVGIYRQVLSALRMLPFRIYLKCTRKCAPSHLLDPRYEQAQVFLERYGHVLSPEQKRTTEAFVSLKRSSWFTRKKIIMKHRLYPKSFVHLLGLLLKS